MLNGVDKNLLTKYNIPIPGTPAPAPVAPITADGPMFEAALKAPDLIINVFTSGRTSGNCFNAPKKFDKSFMFVFLYVFNNSSVAS